VIEGLRSVLAATPDLRFIGAAAAAAGVLEEVTAVQPEIVLYNLSAGWGEVQQFVADLRRQCPKAKVVLWSEELSSTDCYRAVQMGLHGVFSKTLPVESLLGCLRAVAAGRVWIETGADAKPADVVPSDPWARLTARERDIVQLVARGLRNREIAERLSITTGTVKVHLMHVFEKTGAKDRYELALQARTLTGEGGSPGGAD
jgi:DNA-binding NarL/FixJ family response regulator